MPRSNHESRAAAHRRPCSILTLCLLVTGWARAEGPWATAAPFESVKSFDRIVIPNGDKAVYHTLEFPAVPKKPGTRVMLRFQARLHHETPSGWNYYLGVNLNGKPVSGFSPNGTPRLINRELQVTLDEGRPYTWPYWNTINGGAKEVSLWTVMGPGGEALDARVKSDRGELYWFVVDVDDLINYYVTGLDEVVISDAPNKLVLSNGLLQRLVKGAKVDLVLEDLAVGRIPVEDWKKRTGRFLSELTELADPIELQGPGFVVRVGRSGGMRVVKDGQVFGIESVFSSPGPKIRLNAFGGEAGGNQSEAWTPTARKHGDGKVTVSARCPEYELTRTVLLESGRVRVLDAFANTSSGPVGILVEHGVIAPASFAECRIGGVPELAMSSMSENPTLFLRAESACLGVLAEDSLMRLQLGAVAQPNRAGLKVGHFGLAPGDKHVMEWTLYPLNKSSDYWTLVNRIRKDWRVNFTIRGPWEFFHVQQKASLLADVDRLRRYLSRKNLHIVALTPWIDYENYDTETGGLVTREKYGRLMKAAAEAFRAADPTIKVTACMESFPIPLSLKDAKTLLDRLGGGRPSYPLVTPEMLDGLSGITERDRECLFVNPNGKIATEIYHRGKGTPMAAIAAYPVIGNAQHERLMEQARFIKEECGLDGIYVDCFSMAFGEGMARMRYDFSKWDGRTVDIDPVTGRVTRKYTDAGLVGAGSRAALIRYVLQNDGVFVANSFPSVRETQSLPTFRFSESEYCFNPLDLPTGEKPPIFYRMCGELSTPIGLGYRPVRLRPHDRDNYARIIMKSVITYLRHGGLYYYYCNEIPESGRGAGDYGPINHMYPITPVELGPGFIIGKERIVTALSRRFVWPHSASPRVSVFDVTGRTVESRCEVARAAEGWTVQVVIEDWENVAVIE